jgi:hypothetical protein
MFSSEEYTEMLIIYGESGRNANAAERLYRERFPNRLHPSYSKVQHLLPEDYAPRVEFCTCLLEQHAENPFFLKKILFTDESYFSRQGTFNSHNFHVWATENLHEVFIRGFQNRFSINLWAGILGDSLVSIPLFTRRFLVTSQTIL